MHALTLMCFFLFGFFSLLDYLFFFFSLKFMFYPDFISEVFVSDRRAGVQAASSRVPAPRFQKVTIHFRQIHASVDVSAFL